jgi:hypothetical protein
MTGVDQHYTTPADRSELFGATHAWRAMLRQAAAQLDVIAESPTDRPLRVALHDVVDHLNRACALLTQVDTVLDHTCGEPRRVNAGIDIAQRARQQA